MEKEEEENIWRVKYLFCSRFFAEENKNEEG